MRKKIVAGNWKMNLSEDEAKNLHKEMEESLSSQGAACSVYQFVPSLYLIDLVKESKKVTIGGQNGHPEKSGAYTGEISMNQLNNVGCTAILVGHSERRQLFNENNSFLKAKVDAAIENNMEVFFCCGETLEQREENKAEETVIKQLKESVFHLTEKEFEKVVIAYEPIWAIGTGKTASPEQANQMHKSLRDAIANAYSKEIAEATSILYGGSCKPSNAQELLSQSDIDGGLIGGASLKADDFSSIISVYK